LHWYGQQKLTAKSTEPTQKKTTKYNTILPTYSRTQTFVRIDEQLQAGCRLADLNQCDLNH